MLDEGHNFGGIGTPYSQPKPSHNPNPSKPNSQISGRDIFEDFIKGRQPNHRDFKDGDRMMRSLKSHDYMKYQMRRAKSLSKEYCNGFIDKSDMIHRFQSRPLDRGVSSQGPYVPGDIGGVLSGDDMSYIGTYYGSWWIVDSCCNEGWVVIGFRVDNTMGTRSGSYDLLPKNAPWQYGPLASKTQTWMWEERFKIE